MDFVLRKELLEFMDSIISRGNALGDDLDRNSALHRMLRADGWTVDELREGLLTLMFASFDTVMSVLTLHMMFPCPLRFNFISIWLFCDCPISDCREHQQCSLCDAQISNDTIETLRCSRRIEEGQKR